MASSLGTMIAELNSLAGPGNRIDKPWAKRSTGDGSTWDNKDHKSIIRLAPQNSGAGWTDLDAVPNPESEHR
jgi:hypothetical protein